MKSTKNIRTRKNLSPEDYQAIDVVNLSAFEGDDEAKLIARLREQAGYRTRGICLDR